MIYLFGCSFTYGSGLKHETKNRLPSAQTTKYENSIWSKYLSVYTKEEVVNYGVGGASNQFIREEALKQLTSLKKGDTVIIGITSSARISIPAYHTVKKAYYYINLLPQGVANLYEEYNKALTTGEKMHWDGSWVDNEYIKICCDYYMAVMKEYEQFLYDEHLEIVHGLQKILLTVGVNSILWDYTIWSRGLETISEWTKYRAIDGHWSPNGHKFFALILTRILKENSGSNFSLTLDDELFKDMYYKVHEEYLSSPYIKYDP